MEFQDKQYSLESGIAKGRPLPQWALNEPEVYPGDYFYINAFYELGTCRTIGLSIGPIPWNRIVQYADRFKLDEDLINPFVDIIREMDDAYIEEINKKKPKPDK